jgi:phenylalanyl-tRNA synthetase beta subunit
VGPGDSERFEFIMPSDVRVEDVVTGVNESLKDLIEKLRHKDNFKNFIIRYFKKKYAYTCVYYKTLKSEGRDYKEIQKI